MRETFHRGDRRIRGAAWFDRFLFEAMLSDADRRAIEQASLRSAVLNQPPSVLGADIKPLMLFASYSFSVELPPELSVRLRSSVRRPTESREPHPLCREVPA